MTRLSYTAAEKTHSKAKLSQTWKLKKLLDSRDRTHVQRPTGMDRWVVNLTNCPITEPQESVLRLGLDFVPAPTNLPLVDTVAVVEEEARQLADEDAEDFWGWVCGILRRAKLPKDNLTVRQRTAVKELRALEDEVVLPADKGNAMVIMTKEDYDTKLRRMLESSTYK